MNIERILLSTQIRNLINKALGGMHCAGEIGGRINDHSMPYYTSAPRVNMCTLSKVIQNMFMLGFQILLFGEKNEWRILGKEMYILLKIQKG